VEGEVGEVYQLGGVSIGPCQRAVVAAGIAEAGCTTSVTFVELICVVDIANVTSPV
jgi:hypothetical protein